jgi:hypothetical protein
LTKKSGSENHLETRHAEFQLALQATHEYLVQLVQVASDRITPEFEEAVWEAEARLIETFEEYVQLYAERVEKLEASDQRIQKRMKFAEQKMKELEQKFLALGPDVFFMDPKTDKIQ